MLNDVHSAHVSVDHMICLITFNGSHLTLWYIQIKLIKYLFSQKLKLLEICKFNHLNNSIILTLLMCGRRLSLNKWGSTCEILLCKCEVEWI